MSGAHQSSPSGQGLAKLREIGRDGIEITSVQMHRRHQGSGFHRVGIVNSLAQIFLSVLNCSGGDCVAAGKVGQVASEASGGSGPGDSMATDARVVQEDGLAFDSGIAFKILLRRLPLLADPSR
jgi:hypothetical protein